MPDFNINIKKMNPRAVIPAQGTQGAAGYDLCACVEAPVTIYPGETVMIPTGLAMEIPLGIAGLIFARSGLATQRGLAPANKVGVIDADYRGELMVSLYNHSGEVRTVNDGDRIAQMVITPYLTADFQPADELDDTARGSGGFGSTGSK